MKPSLAIVIVTYNDTDTIGFCLERLEALAGLSQVVVIDNASPDQTAQYIRTKFPEVRVIENAKNVGFGTANNQVMRDTKADYYLLLNSDAYLTSSTSIPQALSYLSSHPDVGIAGIPLVFPDGTPQGSAYAFSSPGKWFLQLIGISCLIRHMLTHNQLPTGIAEFLAFFPMGRALISSHKKEPDSPTEVDWICGAAMMVSRACFEATGGFDENIFLYSEDEDLCIRAKVAGFKRVLLPVAPIGHEMGALVHRKAYSSFILSGTGYFINKHFRQPKRLLMHTLLRLKLLTGRH